MNYICRGYAASDDDIVAVAQVLGVPYHIATNAGMKQSVGHLELRGPSERQAVKADGRFTLLPASHSPTNVAAAASALGITATTAREIHAAIFAATNADIWDPDL